jgi:hypothetical protein
VDTIVFLLTKKLNSYNKEEKISEIIRFFNEPELEKILYKMADVSLTYSHEFEDFIT